MKYYPFLTLLTGLIACNNDCPTPIIDDFEKGVGNLVENKNLDEASGLAASYTNQGMMWSHNDSGDTNRIFLMDSLGKGTKEFYLEGAVNRDWEDMAISKFSDGNYIYVGDIGDN